MAEDDAGQRGEEDALDDDDAERGGRGARAEGAARPGRRARPE